MRLLALALILLLPASAAAWDQRHEYIRACHFQRVDFKYCLSTARVNSIVAIITDASDYLRVDEDIAYALITTEDYFMNKITRRIGSSPMPIKRWSFGYTQCTVSTANIVLNIWRTLSTGSPVMQRAVSQYGHITGRDLLYDHEVNIWIGLWHLRSLMAENPLDRSLMQYNGGGFGHRNPISIRYKNRIFLLLDNSHLWREGFTMLPEVYGDPRTFDTRYFIDRLQKAERRLRKKVPVRNDTVAGTHCDVHVRRQH